MATILSVAADVASITGVVFAVFLYGRAHRNVRENVSTHLEIVSRWARSTHWEGWSSKNLDLKTKLLWVNPTFSVFPIAAGPSLVQIPLLGDIVIGQNLVRALIELSQAIASVNSVIEELQALRMNHALELNRAWQLVKPFREDAARLAALKTRDNVLMAANLKPDDLNAAVLAIELTEMLHVGLIGEAGGVGLYRRLSEAESAFNEERA